MSTPGSGGSAHPQVYLASGSPRRRQLLEQIGVRYVSLTVCVPEIRAPGEPPGDYALRMALSKARAGRAALGGICDCPVLGADTDVVLDDEILGKPADAEQAREMLGRLSGRTHQVYSAVALVGDREAARLSVSQVMMRPISAAERRAYGDTGEGADKAGGYAIQGRGAIFVVHLSGSYSAVMGLPLAETAELLRDFGVSVL